MPRKIFTEGEKNAIMRVDGVLKDAKVERLAVKPEVFGRSGAVRKWSVELPDTKGRISDTFGSYGENQEFVNTVMAQTAKMVNAGIHPARVDQAFHWTQNGDTPRAFADPLNHRNYRFLASYNVSRNPEDFYAHAFEAVGHFINRLPTNASLRADALEAFCLGLKFEHFLRFRKYARTNSVLRPLVKRK